MKNTRLTIRIEKPCTEDWDKMTPTDHGKFCAACEKNVTDFTGMTDNEVLEFIEHHTGPKDSSRSKMCGQLRGSQLNRMIVQTKLQGKNYRLNAFFATLLFAGGAGSLAAQDTIPPAPHYHPTVIINEKHPTGPVCIKVPAKKEQSVLKATIMDTVMNQHVEYAVVTLRGTNISAETDNKGRFEMIIPDSLAGDSIVLMVHSPGYFREWVTIPAGQIAKTSVIEVAFNEIMMKGDMLIDY